MNNNLENDGHAERLTACVGCGSSNLEVLEPAGERRIFLTDADEMTVTTGVSGCSDCGLTFLNPRMGGETLVRYYSKQSRIPRKSIDPASPFAMLMESQLDDIEQFKPLAKGMKVLEIGCAEGFFLRHAADRAQGGLALYGVELSEKYLAQAHALLPEATLFEKPLEQTDFGDLKFDLIALRHVFEHLSDPAQALDILRTVLAPGGVVYIEIPDSENIEPSVSRFYHHEHLLYFTVPVLSSYLEANGFKPLSVRRFEGNPVGSGFSYPVIRALCTLGDKSDLPHRPGYARQIFESNARRNEDHTAALLRPLLASLHEAAGQGRRMALFGAGPHTMDLLSLLEDAGFPWTKVFDNNPGKQGKTMRGIPIVKPDEASLKSVDLVLISSAEFENEMAEQVSLLTGGQLETLKIYNNDSAR